MKHRSIASVDQLTKKFTTKFMESDTLFLTDKKLLNELEASIRSLIFANIDPTKVIKHYDQHLLAKRGIPLCDDEIPNLFSQVAEVALTTEAFTEKFKLEQRKSKNV